MQSSCPYIGLIKDPNTTAMYPTPDHGCHRASPPVPIVLHYQNSCCLNPSHTDCPGFQDGWEDGFPKELRSNRPRKSKTFLPNWVPYVVIGIMILLMVIGALVQLSNAG